MQVEVLRSIKCSELNRYCEKGEIIDVNPSWAQKMSRRGCVKLVEDKVPPAERPISNKKILRISRGYLDIAGDVGFITGHKGHLGRLIYKELSAHYQVKGYDLRNGQDILNYDQLKTEMQGCSFVVHSAAIPHPNPKYSIDDYFQTNVVGTLNVLKAAAENKVHRFIYLCSGAVYGWDTHGKMTPLYFPIDEFHPPLTSTMQFMGNLDGYAQSKLIAEQLVAWFGTNLYFKAISLRIAPAVPQSVFFSEKRLKNPKFIPQRQKTFWVNVEPENVARAVMLALETEAKFDFETFNIAEKETHKDVDLEAYLKEFYPDVPIRNWKPPQSLLSVEKAERIFKF